MEYMVKMILCFACASLGQQSLNVDVDYQEFRQAVLNAYDVNRSFSENFYSLLGIICPTSVYCTGNNTGSSENDIHIVWDTVEEDANFSKDFISNYQPSVVPKARNILKRNAHKLRGCCTKCSCETNCIERQNCCPAMGNMFKKTNDVAAESQVTQECVDASITSYLQANPTRRVGLSYFMVTACFLANVSEDIVIKCQQPDPQVQEETRPVYSPSTGRIYKNKYCAACNDDYELTPWAGIITFNEKLTLTGTLALLSTPEEMYAQILLSPKQLNLYFIPSSNMPLDTKTFDCRLSDPERVYGSFCERENIDYDQKYLLTRACAFQQSHYHTTLTYMNVFCFLCQPYIFKSERGAKCTSSSKTIGSSFSALLVYNQAEPGLEAEKENPCKCTEYFDEKKKICRKLECPPGEMFVDCACNAFLRNINHMPVKVYLEVTPEQRGRVAEETIGTKPNKNIVKSIIQKVKGLLNTRFGPLETKLSFLFNETSASNRSHLKLSNVIITSFKSPTDDIEKMKSMFKTLHSGISTRILGIPMKISLGRIFNINYVDATLNAYIDPAEKSDVVLEHLVPAESDLKIFTNHDITFVQTLNKLVYCERVKLEEDEVDLLQSNSAALGLSQSYLNYVFWKEDMSMCLDDFEKAFLPDVTSGKYFCNTNKALALFTTWICCNLWYM